MEKMNENELIHIISAGANIHNTFPVAVNEISGATKLFIIVEDRVYENTGNVGLQKIRDDIKDSIEQLKTIATPFVKNGVHEIRIPEDSLEYVRDAVIKIYSESQNSKFFFNVSGGTKLLSIGLFVMALWIEAVPYIVDQNSQARKLSIPKIHIKDLTENPNRVLILIKLKEKLSEGLTRKDLFTEVEKEYIPIRERGKKKRELKQGTFNALIESLLEWNLIRVTYKKGSKKEKQYYITPDGEFTLNFVKIQHN